MEEIKIPSVKTLRTSDKNVFIYIRVEKNYRKYKS